MLDFMTIATRYIKSTGVTEIYPKFVIKKSTDLMIRGGDFYAVWVEDIGLWSTDEDELIRIVDNMTKAYYEEHKDELTGMPKPLYLWDAESGMIDIWHKYCQKQLRDSFRMLDEKLIFSNDDVKKTDYASKRLPYPLEPGGISAFDKLISTLYSKEERRKIEWAIGAIVTGDSKFIQKFMVLYGSAGTGKSTILNIIQQLFEGYYSVFDAKALGSSSNSFALEAFKTNPLVAIQHDGDLSRIEDNTRLNSLVSHELMTVNEKFKSTYANQFKCFLFMGTNKPVKITDGKSGLIRRLIDVSPTGNKLPVREYNKLIKQVTFELGHIAHHCKEVYLENPGAYDNYTPITMMGASNDFYNFVLESYHVFSKEDGVTLKAAWEMYKTYCDDAKVPYPLSQRNFKEELKNYFWSFDERLNMDDGSRVRSYFSGFRKDKFMNKTEKTEAPKPELLDLKEQASIFDTTCSNYFAQYASENGTPLKKWDTVTEKLSELDTSKLHFVKVPENHIVIDFDICGPDGQKSFERNLEEASKWPATYAEVSKGGAGIHLHYIYTGDPTKLSRIYDDRIEIKVFTGKSSLRRRLTKCNNLPIASIGSGLPLKGETKMINFEGVKNEKVLRTMIKRNLNKEIHASTKCSIDFIYKILEDTYNSDLCYDVSDLYNSVFAFAASSTNQSDYCIKLVDRMKFKSEEPSVNVDSTNEAIIFYDVEVFPNLFLINWKFQGEDKPVVRMINPKPADVEELLHFRLVGFNCRRYDNHMLYACLMGYSNEQLYTLSRKIISGNKNAFFGEAYNISFTDIYDYSSKKQSLKKWEIELGIHHQELGLPWDEPVPEEKWIKVAEYCDNDVLATEAVFEATKSDFLARCILSDVAGMTANDTTNSLTTRIIFGKERNPQSKFNYRNMGDIPEPCNSWGYCFEEPGAYQNLPDTVEELYQTDMYNVFDYQTEKPFFPGYVYDKGKSIYRGEEVGEGGYVYAEPGIHLNVALLDVASMHPHSIIAENLFGEYTERFKDIVDARIAIKHGDFDAAKEMLDGALTPYLTDKNSAKDLANALKIAINSVYGLTSAGFDNPFRDIRNKDNIVAKRGALFMINLKHEIQKRGFTVAHIKTDSIKIPNATPEIIQFVMDYGKEYGYTFEHEATYEKMCLVNDAVYIAKYAPTTQCLDGDAEISDGEWTATGKQFAVPYVFKTLFSREPIEFSDLCVTNAVTSALYLDQNDGLPDVTELEKVKELRIKGETIDNPYTKKERALVDAYADMSDDDLDIKIAEGHDYRFIGKVGLFCPMKKSGGLLMREGKDKYDNLKYSSATGAKGYRWQEAEVVKTLGLENDIDKAYFQKQVDEAFEAIGQYGDAEWFISNKVA